MAKANLPKGEDSNFFEAEFKSQRAKKCMNFDMSVSNKRRKFQATLVRVGDEPGMESIRGVLGLTFGIGITKDAPSLKAVKASQGTLAPLSDTARLCNEDEVRIVTCCPDDLDVLLAKNLDIMDLSLLHI